MQKESLEQMSLAQSVLITATCYAKAFQPHCHEVSLCTKETAVLPVADGWKAGLVSAGVLSAALPALD